MLVEVGFGKVFVWNKILNMFLVMCVWCFEVKDGIWRKWKWVVCIVNFGRINKFLKFWKEIFWEFKFLSFIGFGFIKLVLMYVLSFKFKKLLRYLFFRIFGSLNKIFIVFIVVCLRVVFIFVVIEFLFNEFE